MTFLPRFVVKECCFNYQAINSTGEAATRENIDKLCEITWWTMQTYLRNKAPFSYEERRWFAN